MLRIVGLGPSRLENMSVGAYETIEYAPTVLLRTGKHPAAQDLAAQGVRFETLDYLYDASDTFHDVYERIAQTVIRNAEQGDVVYAVPGHPLAGETSVQLLVRKAREHGLEFEIIGSESFIEASLEALGMGFDSGLKIIDALSMDTVRPAPDVGNLIYQVYDRDIASDVKLRLMHDYPDDFPVMVVSGAGTIDQKVLSIPLYELDRCEFDHLTSVYLPESGEDNRP